MAIKYTVLKRWPNLQVTEYVEVKAFTSTSNARNWLITQNHMLQANGVKYYLVFKEELPVEPTETYPNGCNF